MLCLRVFVTVMKHHDQKQLGKKRLSFAYISDITKGSQDRNSSGAVGQGVGADAEAKERCCLLVCSSWLAQPAFL